ncbi:hypothetical protein CN481_16790 [Bacillus sp. AFS006103]|nr:hypothetical protein CN481_16790 [Bacillus sp. AFS006103]
MLNKYPIEDWYLRYMELGSLNDIGKNFGVSFATIGRFIKMYLQNEYGLVVNDLKKYRDGYYANEWIYLHEIQGLTLKEIAKENNLDERTVSRILKKFGHKVRKYHPVPLYSCNESYFENIDCHEKAYWLGFIYADGCVTFDYKRNSYIVSIALQKSDNEHLESFKNYINSNHPIGKDGRGCVQIRIYSRKMFYDLEKWGVTPNKSKIVIFPNNIDKEYYSSFILGCFDGDGTIYSGKKKSVRAIFSLCSGSRKMLEQIQQILVDKLKIGFNKIGFSGGTFKLAYGGNVKVSLIRDWLYSNSSVYLGRKKQEFFNVEAMEYEYVMFKCPTCNKIKEKPISETHLRRKTKLPVTFCSHSCATTFYNYYRGTEKDKKLINENIVKVIKKNRRRYFE